MYHYATDFTWNLYHLKLIFAVVVAFKKIIELVTDFRNIVELPDKSDNQYWHIFPEPCGSIFRFYLNVKNKCLLQFVDIMWGKF